MQNTCALLTSYSPSLNLASIELCKPSQLDAMKVNIFVEQVYEVVRAVVGSMWNLGDG